jgi:hypothetical protein
MRQPPADEAAARATQQMKLMQEPLATQQTLPLSQQMLFQMKLLQEQLL